MEKLLRHGREVFNHMGAENRDDLWRRGEESDAGLRRVIGTSGCRRDVVHFKDRG
jgi:hypothetical protein